MLYLVVSGDFHLAVLDREAAPKLLGCDVCSVLHCDVLLDGTDQTPELLLHQLSGNHLPQITTPHWLSPSQILNVSRYVDLFICPC